MIGRLQPWLVSKVAFPLIHFLKNDGLNRAISMLERSQWRAPEELGGLQLEKLRALLQHCEQHVPYYREMFAEHGIRAADIASTADIAGLPFLTKQLISDNQDALRADNVPEDELIANSTSGSTGEPLKFFHDRRSAIWRNAVVWRNQKWVGALYSDREVRLWGAQMDISKADSLRGRLHSAIHQKILLSSYELSDESMARYADIIARFRPRLLISYASPLATFAEYFVRNNRQATPIPAVITSAETLYPWQRELIERVFSTRIFDRYGSREFGNIAHQCGQHGGYHINSERFVVEVVDPQGKPAQDGELGELVITDLDNFGFPFVRYRIGDLGIATTETCACGRGLPMLQRVEGRSFDVIETPDGQRVAGTYWTIALRRVKGIRQFQIIQDQPDHLTVRLKTGRDWENGAENEVGALVREKCGERMSVSFEFVDQIDLTKSGKLRLVINQLH